MKIKKLITNGELQTHLDSITIITISNRSHIIATPLNKRDSKFYDTNYRNTNKALIGILKSNETLDEFKKRYIQRISKLHNI
jgi:hypothetical protein